MLLQFLLSLVFLSSSSPFLLSILFLSSSTPFLFSLLFLSSSAPFLLFVHLLSSSSHFLLSFLFLLAILLYYNHSSQARPYVSSLFIIHFTISPFLPLRHSFCLSHSVYPSLFANAPRFPSLPIPCILIVPCTFQLPIRFTSVFTLIFSAF